MRTNNQSEKSKCFNGRIMIVFLFLVYYLLLWVTWNQYNNSNETHSTTVLYCSFTAVILLPLVLLFMLHIEKRQDKKQTLDGIVSIDKHFANKLNRIIIGINKEVITNDDITNAVKSSIIDELRKNPGIINDAIKDGLKNALIDTSIMSEFFRLFVADTLSEDKIKKAVSAILSLDVTKDVIKDIKFDSDTISTAIQAAVTNANIVRAVDAVMKNEGFLNAVITKIKPSLEKLEIDNSILKTVIKEVIKEKMEMFEVIETQKYQFVERIVNEICNSKYLQVNQINALRGVIDDILRTSYVKLETYKTNGIIGLIFSDVNGNRFVVKFNKNEKKIESASPDGIYRMTDHIAIEIEGDAIKDIKN